MLIKKFIIALALSMIFHHCADLINLVQKGNIEKPDVRISRTKLSGLTFEQADLVFDIEIINPNPIGISLAGFDYDLFLNKISFLKGEQNRQMEIKANDTATIQLPLSLLYENIYKTYQRLRNEDDITYELKTNLSFNLPVLGEIRVPVSVSGDVPAIKIPVLSLKYIKMNRLTLTGAEFNLAIGLFNPNNFAFNLNTLDYNLFVNQSHWVEGHNSNRIRIAEKKDNTVIIPFKINFLQISSSLYQKISSGMELDYQLKGKLNLSSSLETLSKVDLPFDLSGNIDLTE
jgi:LEA14-like dessication related protein